MINDVVTGVIDLARGDAISRGVSLTKDLGGGLPAVLADAVQIQQVLLNLIVNGCDAMESVPDDARRLLVTTIREADGVRVTVSDRGAGVPEGRMEHIFEPFVTSKPRRLGLGLAICRSIIDTHDGRLWAENLPDRGAAFSFWLSAMPKDID